MERIQVLISSSLLLPPLSLLTSVAFPTISPFPQDLFRPPVRSPGPCPSRKRFAPSAGWPLLKARVWGLGFGCFASPEPFISVPSPSVGPSWCPQGRHLLRGPSQRGRCSHRRPCWARPGPPDNAPHHGRVHTQPHPERVPRNTVK